MKTEQNMASIDVTKFMMQREESKTQKGKKDAIQRIDYISKVELTLQCSLIVSSTKTLTLL